MSCCLEALIARMNKRTDAGADLACSWRSAQGSEEAIPVGTTASGSYKTFP